MDSKSSAPSSSGSVSGAGESKTFTLNREEELRLEFGSDYRSELTVTKGSAEIFGTELVIDKVYYFQDAKLAVFTWFGCELIIKGTPTVAYTATDTPMTSYINTHGLFLHPKRLAAAQNSSVQGPRCMIVGPVDAGKSSVARMLLSYAVRAGSKPIFIDLDVGQNSISIPGSIAATSVEQPIAAECGDTIFLKAPLVFFHGHTSPAPHQELYTKLIDRLAVSINSRCRAVDESRISGCIINCCGWIDGTGYELIIHAANALSVDSILVVGHERLYAELKAEKRLSNVAVEKLVKSGGVVSRSANARKAARNRAIREYFYGPLNDLCPHQKVLNFKEINVFKVGGGHQAPSSALPIGSKRLIDPNALAKIPISNDLLHSVLAVSYATDPNTLLDQNVAGFVYVSAIDMQKKLITLLCPAPGPMPSNHLIAGSVKWIDNV